MNKDKEVEILIDKLHILAKRVGDWLSEYTYDGTCDYDSVSKYFKRFSLFLAKAKKLVPDLLDEVNEVSIEYAEEFVQHIELERLSYEIDNVITVLEKTAGEAIPVKLTKQGAFLANQPFDAFFQIRSIIEEAQKNILIVDNFLGVSFLDTLCSKNSGVKVRVLTTKRAFKQDASLKSGIKKLNKQYKDLEVRTSNNWHDRFLVIDSNDIYHFGASFKDAGNRGFMFSRVEEQRLVDLLLKQFEEDWDKSSRIK